MKKILVFLVALGLFATSDAQILNKLKSAVSGSSSTTTSSKIPSTSNLPTKSNLPTNSNLPSKGQLPTNNAQGNINLSKGAGKGKIYYVSPTGSNRSDGLSASTPKKEIQAVLNLIKDNNENGATVRVAEGSYLGYMNCGYIEIKNWITLEGGWKSDFSERNPTKYITMMEPGTEQLGTSGAKGVIQISGLDNINYQVQGTLIIDGMSLNLGYWNEYKPCNPNDPASGCPSDKFETGRMMDEQVHRQLIHSESAIAGNVIIRNCCFANSPYFAIQINTRCGKVEIYNNVFVSNRYSSCRVDSWDPTGERCHIDFHHNTVAFSWCRTKEMIDMGYGYEFMRGVNADVHNNIFLCNNYAAIARTHLYSGPDAVIEAKRVTNIYDNIFFMNAADLQLPATGGGKWLNVMCAQFEDLDEKTVPKADGNIELAKGDKFIEAVDPDYLEGFSNIKIIKSSSFDRNSAANQFRQAHGMNMQGTEFIRPTMYGNRYTFEKCFKFFGAKAGYGAQEFK